ncbi:MAG TPA: TetR family transcriptional regulator [Microthrixaceae bacterium]|nr:TetR family transcriptional regulator [Microthrixaceae bacterium]
MTLTQSQLARQERMLEVAAELATEGGFDAVQMRTVAAEADVALGTLYRYFPSKEHLLVSAMLRQIGELADRLAVKPPTGATPAERLIDVLQRATAAQQRQQDFTRAVVRALSSGDESVAPAVREVRVAMRAIIVGAIGGEPTERDQLVGEILEEVWLSALISWISGVDHAASVTRKLEDATRLLLPNGRE